MRDLREMGFPCGHNRVARIMRENRIVSKTKRQFKATTNSKHNLPVAPNLLKGGVSVTGPNQVWVSDITFIPTGEGWLYLATVMDYFSRHVVGWSMKGRMTRDLVIEAFQQAIWRRQPGPGLVHHSDRGSQYASGDYQTLLKKHDFLCSMSGKGNCYDNALMESFYGTLKTELVHHENYRTREEARRSIFEYIEVFYNRIRRHSSLGYRSPATFEQLANVA
jgi:transposase InsO family protein